MPSQRETALFAISDLHYGKKTGTFSPEVFKKRMDGVAERLARIKELQSGYEIDELVICCLGDANDGTDIYATQPHHQAITDVEQQAHELATYLADWSRKLKEAWGPVRWECVPGNHGRGGWRAHECSNWDTACYRYLGYQLEKDGIPVNIGGPKEDPFLRKIKVRGHPFLIYHGHDIRTYSNIPFYGMMLRLSRWLSTGLAPFEAALLGHFHTLGDWRMNRVRLWCTGTAVTDDEWALRTFGWESAPYWHLFGVSDKFASTWHFDVKVA